VPVWPDLTSLTTLLTVLLKDNKCKTKTVDAVPEFNNKIVEKGKIDTLSHKYMAAHFPGLVQVLIKYAD
jgi:hypothetical protein